MLLIVFCFLFFVLIYVDVFSGRHVVWYERGIIYGYNFFVERDIRNHFKSNLKNINLQDFFKKKIIKTCVQSPYVSKSIFEELVGNKVEKFTETSDWDGEVIWFFFENGDFSRVRFPYDWSGSRCSRNTIALFKLDNVYQNNINFFYGKESK